ncbi:2OG-Fe(II) oxygenase [Tenacibaculum sp. MAR_2010_89]|uniref:2OG-Fe(II) oxygenase n=1 Tax=Tenacibaculum sp. MAR_2010_89 TaxID=1250198 RepID=UPI000AFC37DB|nr:2OG-Fe(II) oxygenase [Tenacibaculum sp. MAR_2010_89]
MFRVYKYSSGQRFKMHIDGSFKRNLNEESLFSFLIYLNDDFEGGETEFRKLFTISPKKGTALVFKHRLMHEGKEIISGIKYILRTDIMYKRI